MKGTKEWELGVLWRRGISVQFGNAKESVGGVAWER